jgi:predicted transposase YdaD
MTKKADISGKHTINIYNRAWAEWVLQDEGIQVEAELSGEFQFIGRASDSLLRVHGKDGKPFLSLTELQLRHDKEMPQRTMAYAALARHKYDLEVFVTIVYLLPPPEDTSITSAFHSEFMGQVGHQDFQVIKLWDIEAEKALAFDNPAIVPFVPLMQGGNTEGMLHKCADRIRQEPRSLELETILSVFASYVLDTQLIRRVLRWDMHILKESPILEEALLEEFEKGEQIGEQKGEQKGKQKGKQESSLAALYQTLTIRFGAYESYLAKYNFELLDTEALRELNEVALTAESLAEFEDRVGDIG